MRTVSIPREQIFQGPLVLVNRAHPQMIEMFEFIRDFEGEIPGASPKDCGNYLDMNLGMARYLAGKYLEVLYHVDRFPESRLVYPE